MKKTPAKLKTMREGAHSDGDRFRIALKNSPTIVFEHDRSLRCTWIYNPSPKFGFSVDQIIGKTDAELLTPERARELTALKQEVLKRGKHARKEVAIPLDDHTLYFDITLEPLRDAAGQITGLACATFDVTDRKILEKALQESQRRYATAERIAHLGHFLRDMEADTVYWSPELFRIFGLDPKTPAPRIRRFFSMVHPDDRERLMAEIQEVLSSGNECLTQYRIRRPDGEERILRTTIQPAAGDGHSTRVAGILQDVTHLHTIQKRVAALNLAEREAVFRDLHDTVCQELSAIGFLADSLRENLYERPEEMMRDVENIITSSQKAIDQAKTIARNLKPISDAPVALGVALLELSSYIHRIYGVPCGLLYRKQVFIRDSRVSSQLYFIAREAAINAARHGEASQIRITLSQGTKYGMLRVADDGKGLDDHAKINNSGGLNIMKARAELIGVNLSIRANPKGGTTVECRWKKNHDAKA